MKINANSVFLICLVIISTVLFGQQSSQNQSILIKQLNVSFPDHLFKTVGTKTFNVQYIKLFEDRESKGYLIKAWTFQPVTASTTSQKEISYKLAFSYGKEEYSYQINGVRDKSYVRMPLLLVICPAKYVISINSQVIPEEKEEKTVGGEVEVPIGVQSEGAMVRILKRLDAKYAEITEGTSASKDDYLLIQIVAGTFPTGGYRIEVNEPDIIYPVGNNPGKITITGTFYRPKPGDMVTQAFTTPTKTVEIGKLPAGQYEVIITIKDLGEFRRILVVK
ncbi:MAG: protease complex subunit PrcB family protein [Fervidobacterium sp.]|uniref:protease complex subunit PrcB family protein n=1 Tax=Fervidobacterium sp. TaxID=1871331 RepID=UPI004049C822